jgi:hypothetical protein
MDRRLARKNIRMAFVIGAFSLFVLGFTFVVAAVFIS